MGEMADDYDYGFIDELEERVPGRPGDACECGGTMRQRRNQTTQEAFLGCSEYPRCDFTAPIEDGCEEQDRPPPSSGESAW